MQTSTALCPHCKYPNATADGVCTICGAPLQVVDTNSVSATLVPPIASNRAEEDPVRVALIPTGMDFADLSSVSATSDVGDAPVQRTRSIATPITPIHLKLYLKMRRRDRGIAALIGALVLLSIAVNRLLAGSSAPSPASTVETNAFHFQRTVDVTASAFAGKLSLNQPQEVRKLANGDILVVDTGNRRLVLMDVHGRIVRTISAGAAPFQEPYAVAASSNAFFILDTQLRAIESFDLEGRFQSQVFSGTPLDHPRGLALGPNGEFYIADPASSSIVVVSKSGTLIRKIELPGGPNQLNFNQPSDVAVDASNVVYVMDNGNLMIRVLSPKGLARAEWVAPASSTLFSAHVLPLNGGRLLVSDPAGSLLLYAKGQKLPLRIVLHVRGGGLSPVPISPLGLASVGGGKVLVVDSTGGRILVVTLPSP